MSKIEKVYIYEAKNIHIHMNGREKSEMLVNSGEGNYQMRVEPPLAPKMVLAYLRCNIMADDVIHSSSRRL